jgi:hypothetical protein
MSGPKVINIEAIRRQQQRLCDKQLRQLRQVIAAWRESRKRAGNLDERADAEAAGLVKRLEALRESNLLAALGELPTQIQFFQAEEAKTREAIVEQARTLRDRRRRIEQTAAMLARELQDLGEAPPAVLRDAIDRAGKGDERDLARLEAGVQKAFSRAAEVRGARKSAEDAKVLAKLAAEFGQEGQARQSLRDWIVAKAGAKAGYREKEDRLAALLAEVEAWGEDDAIVSFLDRARAISLEAAGDRRELLTDSLILELAEYRKVQRRRNELADRLREALASLEPFNSPEADALRSRIEQELRSGSLLSAEPLAAEVEAWCDREAKREDAKLRREAVLNALSDLGYAVREGMAVAWAEEGRIVLRKPQDTNYGVELMSPGDNTALQARVVAFDYPGRGEGDRVRDKEVEESWCADFVRMQALIRDAGYETAIRQATPAGSAKVKVIPAPAAISRAAVPGAELSQRPR